MVSLIEKETFTGLFTGRLSRQRGFAQDAKNAKILFFYRIGTDDSIKQSALRAYQRMEPLLELSCGIEQEKAMAVFLNRPFRFEKGFAAFATLRFKNQ